MVTPPFQIEYLTPDDNWIKADMAPMQVLAEAMALEHPLGLRAVDADGKLAFVKYQDIQKMYAGITMKGLKAVPGRGASNV